MKKLLVLLVLVGLVGVGGAFAQTYASASDNATKWEELDSDTVSSLKYFRTRTEKRTEFNTSYILQDMITLTESYMELNKKAENALKKGAEMRNTQEQKQVKELATLAKEIMKPIKAGWLKGEPITIVNFIEHHADEIWHTEAAKYHRFSAALQANAKLK